MTRALRNATEQRVVTIKEINMDRKWIVAEDNFQTTIYISMHFNNPLVAIPQVGDIWIVARQGIDWYLEKRQDTGAEPVSLDQLQSGDQRIHSDNDLHLNTEGSLNVTTNAMNLTGDTNLTGTSNITGTLVVNNLPILSPDDTGIERQYLDFGTGLVNSDIDPNAAVDYSKLALTGQIVDADVSSTAAIAYSKLELTGQIVDGDISNVSVGKILPGSANQAILTNSGGTAAAWANIGGLELAYGKVSTNVNYVNTGTGTTICTTNSVTYTTANRWIHAFVPHIEAPGETETFHTGYIFRNSSQVGYSLIRTVGGYQGSINIWIGDNNSGAATYSLKIRGSSVGGTVMPDGCDAFIRVLSR